MYDFRVGFIGLGIMGRPMAMNLLKADYKLGLYARHGHSLEAFNSLDVDVYDCPATLAKNCSMTITIVSDSPDVEDLICGNNGLIHGAAPGHIIIDMSTISPELTRKLASKLNANNIHMLDAPVSGGEQGAINGTLSIMVGGNIDIFRQALPILRCLGESIIHVGDNGAGQVAKACNQILVAQTMSAVAEAFLLAKSSGVNPHKVRDALLGGFAYSKILEVHGMRMLNDNYNPGFKAVLHNKDMNIALNSAKENNISLPGAELVANYLRKTIENGDGDLDSSAIGKIIFKESY